METEKIKSLIEKSNIDINLKNILERTLCELAKENKQVFDEIKSKVFESNIKSKDLYWSICTILVSKKEKEKYEKLYPVCEFQIDDEEDLNNNSNLYYYENVFLNCSYSEINNILNKTYIAKVKYEDGTIKEVKYYIIFDNSLIEKEKIIYDISNQYNINFPNIFSPYSRKFAAIYIDLVGLEKDKKYIEVDLALNENNLSKYILEDKILLWNLFIENSDSFCSKNEKVNKGMLPYEDEIYYKYKFDDLENNKYILIEDDFYELDRKDESVIVKSKKDINNKYKKVEISEVNEEELKAISEKYFLNEYNKSFYDKKILRTKADVNYVVRGFNKNRFNFSVEYIDFNKEEHKIIQRYGKDFKYHSFDDGLIKFSNKSKCYLKFTGDINSIYFEDYVNYVLSYLENYYPEYTWVGVY